MSVQFPVCSYISLAGVCVFDFVVLVVYFECIEE